MLCYTSNVPSPVLSKLQKIREALSWLNLPSDIYGLWKVVKEHVLPLILSGGSGVLSFVVSLQQGAAWWQAGILAGLFIPATYVIILLGGVLLTRLRPTPKEVPTSQDKETVSEAQPHDPEIKRSVRETRGVDIEDSKWQSKNTQIRNYDVGMRARRSDVNTEDTKIEREEEDTNTTDATL